MNLKTIKQEDAPTGRRARNGAVTKVIEAVKALKPGAALELSGPGFETEKACHGVRWRLYAEFPKQLATSYRDGKLFVSKR